MLAAFGDKTFEVSSRIVYTFTDLSTSGKLRTETKDVDGKKPTTTIKGPGLEELSFNVLLDSRLLALRNQNFDGTDYSLTANPIKGGPILNGDAAGVADNTADTTKSVINQTVRSEIVSWEALRDAHVAYLFVLGDAPLSMNKFLLTDVQTDFTQIDNSGTVLKAQLTLKFTEYIATVIKKKSHRKTKSNTTTSTNPVDLSTINLNPNQPDDSGDSSSDTIGGVSVGDIAGGAIGGVGDIAGGSVHGLASGSGGGSGGTTSGTHEGVNPNPSSGLKHW